MDNSTVAGDNASLLSVPYKDSRPSTSSPLPHVPHIPMRTTSPHTPSHLRREDYFSHEPHPAPYRDAEKPAYGPGHTPRFSPDETYELNSLSSRPYDQPEMTDSTHLLSDDRLQSISPPPPRRTYNM